MFHGEPRPSVMSGSAHLGVRDGRREPLVNRLFGRRRNYLIDTSYQVRTAFVAVLGMACLLVFAAALFHMLSVSQASGPARAVPFPGGPPAGDSRSMVYLMTVGIVFVAAVFVLEILETHKTAGVVHKVTRGLRDLEAGRWGTRVALRRNDNFKEMEEAFNAATRAACDTVDGDLRGLQGIEGQVRLVMREFESGNREGALLLLRQVAAELQGLRERKRAFLTASGGGTVAKNDLDTA
jgi:hypothetical protein